MPASEILDVVTRFRGEREESRKKGERERERERERLKDSVVFIKTTGAYKRFSLESK